MGNITKLYTTLFKSSMILGFTTVWYPDYKELFLLPSIRISKWDSDGNNGIYIYVNWLCFCWTIFFDEDEAANQRGEEKKWNNILDERSRHTRGESNE
jgi:hypothetical protein